MKILVGFLTALLVVFISYLIVHALKVDVNKVNFFIGWISCMGYYLGMEIYEQNQKNKE